MYVLCVLRYVYQGVLIYLFFHLQLKGPVDKVGCTASSENHIHFHSSTIFAQLFLQKKNHIQILQKSTLSVKSQLVLKICATPQFAYCIFLCQICRVLLDPCLQCYDRIYTPAFKFWTGLKENLGTFLRKNVEIILLQHQQQQYFKLAHLSHAMKNQRH